MRNPLKDVLTTEFFTQPRQSKVGIDFHILPFRNTETGFIMILTVSFFPGEYEVLHKEHINTLLSSWNSYELLSFHYFRFHSIETDQFGTFNDIWELELSSTLN